MFDNIYICNCFALEGWCLWWAHINMQRQLGPQPIFYDIIYIILVGLFKVTDNHACKVSRYMKRSCDSTYSVVLHCFHTESFDFMEKTLHSLIIDSHYKRSILIPKMDPANQI